MVKRPIRASQVISPFGVGAMMDFPGPESLIHAGLDAWDQSVVGDPDRRIINEPALAQSLGVDFFVTPPPHDGDQKGSPKLAWLRFPQWHACTACGMMKDSTLHETEPPTCDVCPKKRGKPARMQQVRFVAACRNGHLRDFPWVEWLGADDRTDGGGGRMGTDAIRGERLEKGARLRLKSTGESGPAGLRIELVSRDGTQVLAKRSLAGAFGGDPNGETPLSKIGVACRAENPALGIFPGHKACHRCDAPLLVVLRGAGNLYFADIESAIHIPVEIPGDLTEEYTELFEDEKFVAKLLYRASRSNDGRLSLQDAHQELQDLRHIGQPDNELIAQFVHAFNHVQPLRQFTDGSAQSDFKLLLAGGLTAKEALKNTLDKYLRYARGVTWGWEHVPDGLLDKVRALLEETGTARETAPEQPLRHREYGVFSRPEEEIKGLPRSILKLRSRPITHYGRIIWEYFEHVGLVDTLRETRVLRGFSRLHASRRSLEEYRNLMWRRPLTEQGRRWLPATLVFGEGIFLRFRSDRLEEWERMRRERHAPRLKFMQENLQALARRRGVDPEVVGPRRVMIHTFAHLLINQLVFDSGYGSSSLRERLYVTESAGGESGMTGLLIYTASGDSEGSMGGLVRLGEPGRLEAVIRRALENSRWCSSDPVCIESRGQGTDSCNLAACHSCALLPETSCELQNRMLDRGTVIGTLEQPDIGYFSKLFS